MGKCFYVMYNFIGKVKENSLPGDRVSDENLAVNSAKSLQTSLLNKGSPTSDKRSQHHKCI